MFFFMPEWYQHLEQLGISEVIRSLQARGRPAEWPLHVPDPDERGTSYLPEGKPWYKSQCPCYEGFYLCGGTGAVRCRTSEELLPGVVWYTRCSKDYAGCPYYKED